MQALAGPPPPVRSVLPGLTAQLPISRMGTRGPFPWTGPAVLQGGPGALRTVRHLWRPVAAPLTGVRRRRRQGQGLQFLVLQG